ncbi:MAG: hypothetical protein QM528_01900 [Phycisphaerales bacterium]|nr:hypothetical protein [Phycisphaerales bacterium]
MKRFIICMTLLVVVFQSAVFAQNSDEKKNKNEILSVQTTIRRLFATQNYDSLKYVVAEHIFLHMYDRNSVNNLAGVIELFKSKKEFPVGKIVEQDTPYVFISGHIGVVVGKIIRTELESDRTEKEYYAHYTAIYENKGKGWVQVSFIVQRATN